MARRLERFCSPGKGNGLRALQRVKPGELLWKAEPFAYTVSKKGRGSACENCFSRKQSLLRCSRCKVAKYCDARCQKQAWPEHKRECLCLRSCQPRIPADSVRLVGRVIFKLVSKTSPWLFVFVLSDIKEMSEEMKEGLGHLKEMLQLYLQEESEDVSRLMSGLDLLHLFAKVSSQSVFFQGC
ncbi:histone-lysine N-methyltransferase SMYD3 isoform X1 [Acipenser oxyrinchus oxyrinchus]|uniref:[histone H3]-lysine(4) N-trimethyltransferase n=1 Tax=Acipenser oxyrinchus oxyrinchus TaxID=40147 RepID=A0AAD8G9F7_ACIOX|nr:histone-lysine N-methyltransferase SMYD3 isoform X1 [Acipenser oxyrinchus oxyrinchus]